MQLNWYCNGYIDVCGDYEVISGKYYADVYKKPYTYRCYIWKSVKGWDYAVWLCLLHAESCDLKVFYGHDRLLKGAKEEISQWLEDDFDHSEIIEQWKHYTVSPCFDKDLNLIGDWYYGHISHNGWDKEERLARWNYYNNNYIEHPRYVLYRDNAGKITYAENFWNGCNQIGTFGNVDSTMIKCMLSKLDKIKYERFFTKEVATC